MAHEQTKEQQRWPGKQNFSGVLTKFRNKHDGESCIVCALGNSLSSFIPYSDQIKTIGINNISTEIKCYYCLILDKLYDKSMPGFDGKYDAMLQDNLAEYTFSKYSYSDCLTKWIRIKTDNYKYGITKLMKYNTIPECYTSAYSAIALAIYMGFIQIGVIGFDLYGHKLSASADEINKGCQSLDIEAIRRGVNIYNLSNHSMVDAFKFMNLERFMELYS